MRIIIKIKKYGKMKRKVRNLTKEHKEKIAISMRGKKHSEESKRKMSESMKRYWASIPAISRLPKI